MSKNLWIAALAAAVAVLGVLAMQQQRELTMLKAAIACERAAMTKQAQAAKVVQAARRAKAEPREQTVERDPAGANARQQ